MGGLAFGRKLDNVVAFLDQNGWLGTLCGMRTLVFRRLLTRYLPTRRLLVGCVVAGCAVVAMAAGSIMVFAASLPAQTKHSKAPDTIFYDGKILTGTRLKPGDTDPTPGRVTAVAIRAGVVLAVGSDTAMLALKDEHTKTINLKGAFAMPGFNDAHTHLTLAGMRRLGMDKVTSAPSLATRRRAIELSIQDALSHGVTSVQDFSGWDDWLAMDEMEDEGTLKLRIAEWIRFNRPLGDLTERRASHPSDDPLLHLTMLTKSMDGALESRNAAMNEPYSDDPGNFGPLGYSQQTLNRMATERAADGFQLGFDATGDLANDRALDALAAAEQVGRPANVPPPLKNPGAAVVTTVPRAVEPSDFRFRIERAEVVSPGAFERFAQLGVIASMQPAHLLTGMAWAETRLGPERSKDAYAWKSFLDHGVTLAFGSDDPAEPISPFRGLYAAMTRKNVQGTQTFEPQETLTIEQAIYAYTQGSAFAEFRERIKGRLEPGYLADMVVLDRDITKATPREVLHTRVLRTVLGGNTVYMAPAP